MRLKITHQTSYRYDQPVQSLVQSLRLTPSVFEGQRVVDWAISVSGGQRGAAFRDGAGDWIEGWTVRGPVEEVTVAIEGQIDTRDTAGVLRGHREGVNPLVYLRATALTKPDAGLRELAASVTGDDALDLAHKLSAAVSGAIAYLPGVTEAITPGVSYIHVMFDRHEIVQSDGIWSESFQPAERSLSALDAAVRDEVLALFPDLAASGDGFAGARLSLKAHEARVLLAG